MAFFPEGDAEESAKLPEEASDCCPPSARQLIERQIDAAIERFKKARDIEGPTDPPPIEPKPS